MPKKPTRTAASAAKEHTKAGLPRGKARRKLRDEFGATDAEADDLLDDAASSEPDPEPATPAESSSKAAPARAARAASNVAGASGGLILGAFAYVLGVVYFRGGTDGVKAWFAAKFLNRVSDPATAARGVGKGTP